MSKFICIGFDVRVWPFSDALSADATAWPQDEEMYELAKQKLGLQENFFQLIHPKTPMDLKNLIDFVKSTNKNVTLIALAIPKVVLNACCRNWTEIEQSFLNSHDWQEIGFDVCDYNGFFSIFHMGILKNNRKLLFSKNELQKALLLSQASNFLVPSHSPFIVVDIYKNRK